MKTMPDILSRHRAIAALVLAAALAAACGGGGKGGERPSVSPDTSIQTPQAADTTPTAQPPPATPLAPPPATPSGAEAIGIYPTSLKFPYTLRGREYFGSVGLINGGPAERTYKFEMAGDAAPWLSLVSEADRTQVLNDVSVPPASTKRVILRAVVPPSVANGDYGGSIQVVTVAGGGTSEGSGVGVSIGAEIQVSLAVTGTEKIEGAFIEAASQDVESGFPLRVYAALNNTGNVQMNPTIDVDILDAAGNLLDHLSSSDEVIYPSEQKRIISEWDTTGRAIGERTARVAVKFGALDLGTKEVRFKIVPAGTFSRRGELQSLQLVNRPLPGDMAKLVATFRNIGQIETKSKFVGELYLGDRLVAQVSSQEQLVLPSLTAGLEVVTQVTEKGQYTVRGKVNYEGRETDAQEFSFRVGPQGGGMPVWVWPLIAAGALAAAGVAAGAGWTAWRRKGAARGVEE